MEKRFQVFVSSTFTDLREERQGAVKAVLELNHMPAGMELFPASDETAWQLIRDVIDASDYYLLIIGGRYGSEDGEGLGYTEKEYDYAVETKKPVIACLHRNPGALPRDKTDKSDAAWAKLEKFRAKVEDRHTCVYWESTDELCSRVITGLTTTVKKHPAVGWVRADQVPSGSTLADILELRNRVAELEAQLRANATAPPPGTEDLDRGDDPFPLVVSFDTYHPLDPFNSKSLTATIVPSWNQLFAAVAPSMINEATSAEVSSALETFVRHRLHEEYGENKLLHDRQIGALKFKGENLDTCIVQFRALGLISESKKQRSVRDKGTYWRLTPYGDHLMTQLRAVRRGAMEGRQASAAPVPDPTP